MNPRHLLPFLLLLAVNAWGQVTYIGGDADYDTDANGTTVLDVPPGTAAGDTAVISTTMPSGGGWGALGPTPSTGCTMLLDTGSVVNYNTSRHTIWACTFSGTPPSTLTFTDFAGGSFRIGAAQMVVLRGINPASYDLPALVSNTSGTITEINHPSTTVPGSGGAVLMIGHWDSLAITPTSLPSGYTMRFNTTYGGGPPTPNTQYIATNTTAGPGATGPLLFQFAANNAGKVIFTVSFAASGGGSSGGLLLRRRRS